MNDEQLYRLAKIYIEVANIYSALATLEAMKAENEERRSRGYSDAWNSDSFNDIASIFNGCSTSLLHIAKQ